MPRKIKTVRRANSSAAAPVSGIPSSPPVSEIGRSIIKSIFPSTGGDPRSALKKKLKKKLIPTKG